MPAMNSEMFFSILVGVSIGLLINVGIELFMAFIKILIALIIVSI